MQPKFVCMTALRYFSAKKANKLVSFISWFSLLGVTIGVAALIVVMSVMEGFHIEFSSNIRGLGGDITINTRDTITNYEALKEELESIPGIIQAIPQIQEKALVVSGSKSLGVLIKGLNHEGLNQKISIMGNMLAGNIQDIFSGYNIALGKELAINLGVRIGDEVSILVSNNVSTILGNLPRKKTFKVVSVFSSPMFDYDSMTILLSLDSAQKLFSYDNSVNLIEAYTDQKREVEFYTKRIKNILGDGYYAHNWKDQNAQFLNALAIERTAMFTILSLIVIVAAFNIVSSLFMLVNEKRRDIAILKTIGAKRSEILMIFMINGSLIGIIGTCLGAAIGVIIASNIDNIRLILESFSGVHFFDSAIYFLYHLPSKILPINILLISIMSITLSIVATIYPAFKASTIDPSQALRDE
ncbi:MAG: lipoprotein-releasing ABC transporter permease subunit [Alphaproteobacteria bacterium]|nr:lipoprotein-releasing ABC transporter permease subunit [Alphaproteobacteria bacterium]